MRAIRATPVEAPVTPPIHSYSAFGLRIDSQLPLESVCAAETGPADLSIVVRDLGISLPAPNVAPVFDFSPERQLLIWGVVGAFEICGDCISVQPADGADSALISLPLLGPVMALWLHMRGTLALHASAIAIGGRGIVLMADKGTGKSTTAATLLSRGHALLSDDVVAIAAGSGAEPAILPSFPRLKLAARFASSLRWRTDNGRALPHAGTEAKRQYDMGNHFRDSPIRLSRLYVLERGAQTLIQPLDMHAGLGALLRFSFVSRFGSRLTSSLGMTSHLAQCAGLAHSIGAARLVVADDLARVGEIEERIEADLARQ